MFTTSGWLISSSSSNRLSCSSDDWLAVVAISDWLVAVADCQGVVDSLGGSSCHSMSLSSSELSTVLIIIDGYVYLFLCFHLPELISLSSEVK